MEIPYIYRGTVKSVTDADTIVITLDLGFNMSMTDAFRLYGINAPELSTAEGKIAKGYVEKLLPVGTSVVVKTHKNSREKYGRWLAKVFLNDVDVNLDLVAKGYAVTYLDNIKNF